MPYFICIKETTCFGWHQASDKILELPAEARQLPDLYREVTPNGMPMDDRPLPPKEEFKEIDAPEPDKRPRGRRHVETPEGEIVS